MVYIALGTVCGFRHPLGTLEHTMDKGGLLYPWGDTIQPIMMYHGIYMSLKIEGLLGVWANQTVAALQIEFLSFVTAICNSSWIILNYKIADWLLQMVYLNCVCVCVCVCVWLALAIYCKRIGGSHVYEQVSPQVNIWAYVHPANQSSRGCKRLICVVTVWAGLGLLRGESGGSVN